MSNANENRLGTEKISKLIISMALPAVAAQLINVLYNIIDRVYIGHMDGNGAMALTGVGVTLPIITLIAAFTAFAGSGGAPLASIALGRKDTKRAEQILGNSTCMLLIFSVILTVGFTVFKEPILYLFGASGNVIQYAMDYIGIYLIGTIFVQFAVGLNVFISAQGNARTAMLSVLIGAVLNIILDPVFIFGFHMGVKGAALATVISQAVSAVWVVGYLCSSKSFIRIKMKNIRLKKEIALSIAALGIAPFIMQSTESLVILTLNTGLQKYGGDLYVGSMTVLTSVMQLIVIPTSGITNGIQPIISFNYGAADFERVKKTFRIMLTITLTMTMSFGLLACLFPELFAGMFTTDPELISLIHKVMPVYFFGMCFFGIQMACQSTFLGLGQAKISLFLALLRKVILLIPLAVLLPLKFGVMGIYYAEPVADITAVLTTLTVFIISYKKILSKADV